MASKKGSKGSGGNKSNGSKRKKTGQKRRSTQAKVGRPGVDTPPDVRTPESASDWLEEKGRSELAGGRTLRVEVTADIDAVPAIAAVCKTWAGPMKDREVHPNLVAGAQLVAKKASATESQPVAEPAQSPLLTATASRVMRYRSALLRRLPGARNAKTRRLFGLHVPMHPITAASVGVALKGLISGVARAKKTSVGRFILDTDLRWFHAQGKAIKTEAAEATTQRGETATQATTLEILTAALEYFFDMYGAAVDVVIDDEVEKLQALKLIPRREERRGKSEDGGGTGSGTGTGS